MNVPGKAPAPLLPGNCPRDSPGFPSIPRDCPRYCPPGLDFVFKPPYSPAIAFFPSKTMFGISCERKSPISDSCAFSDERPGRLCFRSITQESALLWSFRFVSDSSTKSHFSEGLWSFICIPGVLSCYCPPGLVFVLMRFPASEMHFLSENDVRYALVKENGL